MFNTTSLDNLYKNATTTIIENKSEFKLTIAADAHAAHRPASTDTNIVYMAYDHKKPPRQETDLTRENRAQLYMRNGITFNRNPAFLSLRRESVITAPSENIGFSTRLLFKIKNDNLQKFVSSKISSHEDTVRIVRDNRKLAKEGQKSQKVSIDIRGRDILKIDEYQAEGIGELHHIVEYERKGDVMETRISAHNAKTKPQLHLIPQGVLPQDETWHMYNFTRNPYGEIQPMPQPMAAGWGPINQSAYAQPLQFKHFSPERTATPSIPAAAQQLPQRRQLSPEETLFEELINQDMWS